MTTDPGDHRRKWDRDEYEKIAKARSDFKETDEKGEPVKRELLKTRDYKVFLPSMLSF